MLNWDQVTCVADSSSGGGNSGGFDDWSSGGWDTDFSSFGFDDFGGDWGSATVEFITICPDGRYRTSGNYCMDCGINCVACADETGECT